MSAAGLALPAYDAPGDERNDRSTHELQARLQQAQRQLLQSEKLAAIGQLAAGVAHEINNPIGYVMSNIVTLSGYINDLLRLIRAYESGSMAAELQRLRDQIDIDFLTEDIVALVAESQDGIDRVRQIVASLKDFSRADDGGQAVATDLHQCVESALTMCRNELKYKAVVRTELAALPPVVCRAPRIGQVLINLLVNAAHAIEENGEIVVRALPDGDGARIEIEDNGHGIPAQYLDRIFEPFFTTKPVGQGTGLGLSLSYGIVRDHGGTIKVESTVGRGTCFRVWLPLQPPSAIEPGEAG